jgi:LuxR family transcriptional regulator, quorum-sensing system regulator BjaR1
MPRDCFVRGPNLRQPRKGTSRLTPREHEVLTWVARGKSAWEIGKILKISKRTVDEHAATAVGKLGAVSRVHAVALAMRDGLIEV